MSDKNPHRGATLDAEGIREAAKAGAVTRVVTWQLRQEMERQGIIKATLAERMHTSRAQVDRILKAKGNITIDTLQRAAALVGRELRLQRSPHLTRRRRTLSLTSLALKMMHDDTDAIDADPSVRGLTIPQPPTQPFDLIDDHNLCRCPCRIIGRQSTGNLLQMV